MHIGQNQIEIDVSDQEGATTTYKAKVAIFKASEKAVINDDRLNRKFNQGNWTQPQDKKEEPKSNTTFVNPPGYWFAYIEKVSVVGDVFIRFN